MSWALLAIVVIYRYINALLWTLYILILIEVRQISKLSKNIKQQKYCASGSRFYCFKCGCAQLIRKIFFFSVLQKKFIVSYTCPFFKQCSTPFQQPFSSPTSIWIYLSLGIPFFARICVLYSYSSILQLSLSVFMWPSEP